MLGFGLALLGLALALHGVDWKVAQSSVSLADRRWLGAAVLCILVLVFVRTMRWWLLFPGEAPLYRDLYVALLGGQVADTLFFARAGDVARVYLQRNSGKVRTAVTILTEKFLDVLAVVFLGTIAALGSSGHNNGLIPWPRIFLILAGVIGLVLTALISRSKKWQDALFRHDWKTLLGNRIREMLQSLGSRLRSHLDLLRWGRMGALAGISLLIWLGGALVNYLLFRAFRFPLNFGAAILLVVVLIFGTALPTVPGRIGVFHFLCVLFLSSQSIDKSQALGYAALLHLIVFGTPLLLFVFSLGVVGSIPGRRSVCDPAGAGPIEMRAGGNIQGGK